MSGKIYLLSIIFVSTKIERKAIKNGFNRTKPYQLPELALFFKISCMGVEIIITFATCIIKHATLYINRNFICRKNKFQL